MCALCVVEVYGETLNVGCAFPLEQVDQVVATVARDGILVHPHQRDAPSEIVFVNVGSVETVFVFFWNYNDG